jgi:hypothetical protein
MRYKRTVAQALGRANETFQLITTLVSNISYFYQMMALPWLFTLYREFCLFLHFGVNHCRQLQADLIGLGTFFGLESIKFVSITVSTVTTLFM